MLKTEAHGVKLNEFYYLSKKEAKFFIIKKINRQSIIKNGIVINMFGMFNFEPWFVFELKVSEMQQTMLNV